MNCMKIRRKIKTKRLLLIYTFLLALISDSTFKDMSNLRGKGTKRQEQGEEEK